MQDLRSQLLAPRLEWIHQRMEPQCCWARKSCGRGTSSFPQAEQTSRGRKRAREIDKRRGSRYSEERAESLLSIEYLNAPQAATSGTISAGSVWGQKYSFRPKWSREIKSWRNFPFLSSRNRSAPEAGKLGELQEQQSEAVGENLVVYDAAMRMFDYLTKFVCSSSYLDQSDWPRRGSRSRWEPKSWRA